MNEFTVRLDLAKGKARQQQTVFVRQGDKNATTIVATITDHGVAASTSGLTARFQMRLPDGTHYYRKAASLSGNVATVALDEAQAASVAGRTDVAYFQLLQGSTVVASTESFSIVVLPDALADADVAESYDSAIQDAIDALDDAVADMPDMVEDVLADHPEWTTTVQDNSLDDDKLIQKGGILQREQWLETMLPNIPRKATAEADLHSVADSAGGGPLGIEVYGRSTQDGTPTPSSPVPIVSVAGQLYQQTVYAAGATYTTAGIAVTQNVDGTCTVSGTATGNAWLWGGGSSAVAGYYVTLPAGTYTVCGSHSVAAQKMVGSTVSSLVGQTAGSATFTLTEETLVKAVPVIPSGTTVSGETAWVAVYAGSTAYPYVPYGNVGLWARGRNLVGDLAAIKARNTVGTWSGGTYTLNGVSLAFNEDGSIVANGTSTGLSFINLAQSGFLLPAGTYHLSGCPAGGGTTTYRLDVERVGASVFADDSGSGVTFTLDTDTNVNVRLRVPSGAALANKVFWPMLSVGAQAQGFVPYTSTVMPIPIGTNQLRSLPDGTRDEVNVDEWGHARLIQRVGHIELDGSSDEDWRAINKSFGVAVPNVKIAQASSQVMQTRSNRFVPASANATWIGSSVGVSIANTTDRPLRFHNGDMTLAEWKTWLASNPVTVDYPLATPQTIDLGQLDPALLPAPDLTAYVVPSAPTVLRYGFDVAQALAEIATS